MTHPYPSLVRTITTPTLKVFVESCLQLISQKGREKIQRVPQSLVETVFHSFFELVQCYTTTFRPFAPEIRKAIRPYLAPAHIDGVSVSLSLKRVACELLILLHHTAPSTKQGNESKHSGAEEWNVTIRDLVNCIHLTADQVFRGVVEDWESTSGYFSSGVDVDNEPAGGVSLDEIQRWKGTAVDLFQNLPAWSGIDAGLERLTGLLELLDKYFRVETPAAVSIPLGLILDLLIRMLSIDLPDQSADASSRGGVRLNPSISRDEIDNLWSGLPKIYAVSLQVVLTLSDRLQGGFLPIARAILDQIVWIFPSGKSYQEFRVVAYDCMQQILEKIGRSLDKALVSKLSSIIRSCCADAQDADVGLQPGGLPNSRAGAAARAAGSNGAILNPDTILRSNAVAASDGHSIRPDLVAAAQKLLPFLFSHLLQNQLHNSLRSELERTAILTHSRDAMLAAILNPYIAKNGKSFPSLLPHLCRQFPEDNLTEAFLRPRMPPVPSSLGIQLQDMTEEETLVDQPPDHFATRPDPYETVDSFVLPTEMSGRGGLGPSGDTIPHHHDAPAQRVEPNDSNSMSLIETSQPVMEGRSNVSFDPARETTTINGANAPLSVPTMGTMDVNMMEDNHDDTHDDAADDSDDESVHLTMQLDSDSDVE